MKKISMLVSMALLLCNCGTTQSARSGKNTASKRFVHTGKSTEADSVVVSGTQYIPVLGKNEAGIRPDLRGTWILQSMPGTNYKSISSLKEFYQGKDKIITVKLDSTVTKTKDGVTRTEKNITYMDDNRGNKITPPQGSNYHIPEPPSLNFYGSNETFAGFTGCNKISGRFSTSGSAISFSNATASTKMVCMGDYDESTFLSTLRKVNSFTSVNGQLQLKNGDNLLMVFSKKQ